MTPKDILTAGLAWRPGKLAQGTARIGAGMWLRSLAQGVVFLLIGRLLGVDGYGALAAILALAGAAGGLVGVGTQSMLVRQTVRDRHGFPAAWGVTLAAIAISAPALLLCYLGLTAALLPAGIPGTAIVLLGISELVLAPLCYAAMTAYQGHERLGRSARLLLAPVIFRLCAALALLPLAAWLPDAVRLDAWAGLYLVSTLLATAYALVLVTKDLGRPVWPDRTALRNGLAAAFPFGLGIVTIRLYSDIDKVMLAQLAALDQAGAYSAAHRIVEFAAIPVVSLLTAAMPTLFRRGNGNNVEAVVEYSSRIAPIPALYALAAGAGMYLLAGAIPLLLGGDFSQTVSALRWLAWLPLLSLPRLLFQRQFVGLDRQTLAVGILAGGALLNIVVNFELIPIWGWRGAVVSTYAAEVVMALVMGWQLRRSRRRYVAERR